MKELILQSLNEAFDQLEKYVPQTYKKIDTISILDVKPIDLLSFMKDNNIPDDAVFDYTYLDILLSWSINVPTTEDDKLKYRKNLLQSIGAELLYVNLTNNGYKTIDKYTDISLLNEFKDTTIYDMYTNNELDRLEKYYSLYFKLI